MKIACSIAFILLCLAACRSDKQKAKSANTAVANIPTNTDHTAQDSGKNEWSQDKINAIRANFKRINHIGKWTKVDSVSLETTEGGIIKYYFLDGRLEKIIVRAMGKLSKA